MKEYLKSNKSYLNYLMILIKVKKSFILFYHYLFDSIKDFIIKNLKHLTQDQLFHI